MTVSAMIFGYPLTNQLNGLCRRVHEPLKGFPTMLASFFVFDFYHTSELYTMACNFMLYFDKYLLLKLICYLIYSTHSFHFKIYVIQRIELVSVNIGIDKLVLY